MAWPLASALTSLQKQLSSASPVLLLLPNPSKTPLCPSLPHPVGAFDPIHGSLLWEMVLLRWGGGSCAPGLLPASHTTGLLCWLLFQPSGCPSDPARSPLLIDQRPLFLHVNLHLYVLGSNTASNPAGHWNLVLGGPLARKNCDNNGHGIPGTVSQGLKR